MLTENDVKEELSVAYALAVSAYAGFSLELTRKDRDSVDVTVCASKLLCEGAAMQSPKLDIQLKAQSFKALADGPIPFDLKKKNYDDLIGRRTVPRILVVLVMPQDRGEWVSCTPESLVLRRSAYWMSLARMPPTTNTRSQRLYLPRNQEFNPRTLKRLLECVAREEELLP
jgi:uncharacterized protein DUF4365